MKYAIALFLVFSAHTFAESKEAVKREPARAPLCPNLADLKQKYSQLNLASDSDMRRGQEDLSQVADCLQSFPNRATDASVAAFSDAIALSASALPFDMETSLADGISDLIANPRYEKAFQATLPRIETCHRNFLYNAVYARVCDNPKASRYCVGRPEVTVACTNKLFPQQKASK